MNVDHFSVSVIIPVYNGEDFLRECLDSVLKQGLKDIQIICVNDGSTDKSCMLLREYQRGIPNMVIIDKENGGLSSARNTGLSVAQGEYIQFLDCDDRLADDALNTLYAKAHENKLDVLYYDGMTFYDDECLQESHSSYETLYTTKIKIPDILSGESMFLSLYKGQSYRASACLQLIRREYLIEHGFSFYEGIYYEDNLFTLYVMLGAARTAVHAEAFYQRRMRSGSIVTSPKKYTHVRSYLICFVEMAAFSSRGPYSADVMAGINAQLSSLLSHAQELYAQLSDAEKKRALREYPDAIWMRQLVQTAPQVTSLKAFYGRMLTKPWFRFASLPLRLCLQGVRAVRAMALKSALAGLHLIRKALRVTSLKAFYGRMLTKPWFRFVSLPLRRCLRGVRAIRAMTAKPTQDRLSVSQRTNTYHPSNQYSDFCAAVYNEQAPFVSVIIPVYNVEKYLQQTLNDLLEQTLRNFEVILVDDGSTDQSVEIIQHFAEQDKRFHLLRQENAFAGVARNHGLVNAKGEYLLFLDSDDCFHPGLLALAYDRAKTTHSQIVIFDADILKMPSGQIVNAAFLAHSTRLPTDVFRGQDVPAHIFDVLNSWTKLYQRSYIVDEGFRFQSLYSTNDAHFTMMALASAERIITLPQKLVHYRVGAEGNIQSKKDRSPLDVYDAFAATKEALIQRGHYGTYAKPLAAKAMESMLRQLDTLKSFMGYQTLYNHLHDGGLVYLGIDLLSEADMPLPKGPEILKRCLEIKALSFNEYLMKHIQKA